ncbi:glycosyltransferase family 4 protein [Roseomonas sp. HJA6]|uniref:Glycosyltransferase family 4 protein n=1 Tax=Roseomonas alba TaxID=2846776 RepID=A0ABS7A3D3_9PROT|nr:glycosyltransferase family 4 protein [Neoroseomonas alba]MBW6396786.1 glycosyltransferase family 4 protein [Neoroseomonas alba]
MRLAITHATCWPEIRRGSERMLAETGRVLAARGHDVTAISTTPGLPAGGEERRGDVRYLFLPRREPPGILARLRQVTQHHLFAWDLRWALRDGGYDSVLCLGWHDAAGALVARRGGAGFRLAVVMTGIPIRAYFRRTPCDGFAFRRVLAGADAVVTISHFATETLRAEFGRDSVLLPVPVDDAAFAATSKPGPDGVMRILFVGDADEPRKGALLLAQAYAMARPRLGAAARLGFSGRASEATRMAILDALPEALRDEVDFHGVGAVEDLPALLARASLVVNPAVWEALGMVLIEALAAGTPVVGCAHGGIPDIIDDPRIGTLFDPGPFRRVATNVEGLAEALLRGAALAGLPETAALCRARAGAFAWTTLAPRYEALLRPQGARSGVGVR